MKDVETVVIELKVDWQVDHDLVGNSILVPQEFGVQLLDSYFSEMVLGSSDPENILSCVQEAYVEGEAGRLCPSSKSWRLFLIMEDLNHRK